MSVTTTKLKDWSLAIDNMASPAQLVVMHRSVGIARLPYVAETRAVVAYLVQVGVPEATARALAVRFMDKFRISEGETPGSPELGGVRTSVVPRSLPPTSRATRMVSHTRSPTGSARSSFSASRHSPNRPLAR
jgi:hypothetical protein